VPLGSHAIHVKHLVYLRGEAQHKFASSVSPSEYYDICGCSWNGRTEPWADARSSTAVSPVERMAWIWVLTNEKADDETRTWSAA